jgi:hypothetical protein
MDSSAIGDQIELILRSQTFASKGQLRKLLGLLLKNMDSQAALSPELVIRELWPDEIRTKRSADVATEMNRLRHALKTYYDGEGASDPILICLPNRAPTAGNGTHEKPWVTAQARAETENGAGEDRLLESQASLLKASPRSTRKKVALIAALATAVGITSMLAIRFLAMPDQPRLGRLDGSALVIMNAEGKELWRKVFPEGFGPDWYYAQWQPTRIWFGDLEGKGHTSVLFSYSPASPLSHSSTLICYSDRGKEKWRWTPGRELPELAGSPATFVTHAVRVLKATDKRPPQIVVLSQHYPWWPGQVAILDFNGKTVSEYWHSGGLSSLLLADLDGDGKEEIIATGVANGYDHQATLVVLDPDRVFGASTEETPEFQIHGMGAAKEKLRLLFPRSDLNRALFQYGMGTEPTFENGTLRLSVLQCTTPFPGGCRIFYEFDKNFRLIAAYAGSDEFRSAHERFFQSGKNAHTLSAEEQAAFLKVRCLVGCKSEFVPVGKLVP